MKGIDIELIGCGYSDVGVGYYERPPIMGNYKIWGPGGHARVHSWLISSM